MKKQEFKTIDEMNLTPKQREQHFFRVGYGYALLHLQLGLKEAKLEGLEKTILKHLDFLNKEKVKGKVKGKVSNFLLEWDKAIRGEK